MKRTMFFAPGGRGRLSQSLTAATVVVSGLALTTTALASAAWAGPGGAWETMHEEYGPDTFDFCGLMVEQSTVLDGRVRTTARGPDGLPHYAEHVDWIDTWTNVATGVSVTSVVSSQGGDLKVTDNGDGTLTFLVQGSFTELTYDEAGQLIARRTGVNRYAYVVDHAGTPTDPTDDQFLEALGGVKRAGLDPDFCDVLVQATG